jgi:hypothetical protein
MTTEQRPPGRIRLVEATADRSIWCEQCSKRCEILAKFIGAGGYQICSSCLREALRLVHVSDGEALVDRVAEAIYYGGMSADDFERETGVKRLLWKTDAPWDSNPNELCEHERDDYREMARAAIEVLDEPGAAPTDAELKRRKMHGRLLSDEEAAEVRKRLGIDEPSAGKEREP